MLRNPAKATHMKGDKEGDKGRQRETRRSRPTKRDKAKQDAQEPGKGHPHEGRQRETKGDKTLRNPAKTTPLKGDKRRQRERRRSGFR